MLPFFLVVSMALGEDESDDARARRLYDDGAVLYEEGRYEDAVTAFEAAYRLSGRPALLFNIANALERLGRMGEALDVLSRYRAYAPVEERETLDRRIGNLERRIEEARRVAPVAPVEAPAPLAVAPVLPTVAVKRTAPVAPWLVAGGGLAVIGVGGFFGANAADAHQLASDSCADSMDGALRCRSDGSAALATEAQAALLADVLFAAGIVGVGSGVAIGLWGRNGVLTVGPATVMVQAAF